MFKVQKIDQPLVAILLFLSATLLLNAWLLCHQQSPESIGIATESETKCSPDNQSCARAPAQTGVISTASYGENAKEKAEHGADEGTEYWPKFFGIRLKITDSLLILFTAVLAIFTGGLWLSTHRLWTGAEKQITIAERSVDAAVASLARPWLVIEDVKCNWYDWTSCKDEIVGQFRIGNYGKAPALIIGIDAVLFQSPPNGFPVNPLPKGVMNFPSADELREFINKHGRKPFTETEISDVKTADTISIGERTFAPYTFDSHIAISAEDCSTNLFFRGHKKLDTFIKAMPIETKTDAYLLGRMTYELLGQGFETINFCFKGNRRGAL